MASHPDYDDAPDVDAHDGPSAGVDDDTADDGDTPPADAHSSRRAAFDDLRVVPVDLVNAPALDARAEHADASAFDRPATRADCIAPGGPHAQRPCPWLSCQHHALHVLAESHPVTRALLSPTGDAEGAVLAWLGTAPVSCTLDAAETPRTLDECGAVLGVTRERVRQIESKSIRAILVRAPRALRGPLAALGAHLRDVRESDTGGGSGYTMHQRTRTPAASVVTREATAPAEHAALPHPLALAAPGDRAWCPTLRAPITGALCVGRHTAKVQSQHGWEAKPLYTTCASCPWGATVAERLATAGPDDAARVIAVTRTGAPYTYPAHNTPTKRRLPVLNATETTMLPHLSPPPGVELDAQGTADGRTLPGTCVVTGCDKPVARKRGRTKAAYTRLCSACAGKVQATACDLHCTDADAVAYFAKHAQFTGFATYLHTHDLPRRPGVGVGRGGAFGPRGASSKPAPAPAPAPAAKPAKAPVDGYAMPVPPPVAPPAPPPAPPTPEPAPAVPPTPQGTGLPYRALLDAAAPFGLRGAAQLLRDLADYIDTPPKAVP